MIVMLAGKRRSGKTTVRKYLGDYVVPKPLYLSITDEISGFLYDRFDVDIGPDHGDLTTYERTLMIKAGELIRCADEDQLIRGATSCINEDEDGMVYIIDQFRFPREYAYVREEFPKHTVLTIRLTRLGDSPEPGFDKDPTECALDDFNFDEEIAAVDGNTAILCSQALAYVNRTYLTIPEMKVDRVICKKYQVGLMIDSFEEDLARGRVQGAVKGMALAPRRLEETLIGWLWDYDYFNGDVYRDC